MSGQPIEPGQTLTAGIVQDLAWRGSPVGKWLRRTSIGIEDHITDYANATAIAWDSTVLDTWGSRSLPPDNARIRPPIPGRYTFEGSIGFGGVPSGARRGTLWRVNGEAITDGSSRPHVVGSIASAVLTVEARTLVVDLDGEEDYVELCGLHDATTSPLSTTEAPHLIPYLIMFYAGSF